MSVRGAVGMNVADRNAILIKRWREGVATADIAARLGMEPRKVLEAVRRLRRRGVEMPSRSTMHVPRSES